MDPTSELSALLSALYAERAPAMPLTVRMPTQHAALINPAGLPEYKNGGGRMRAMATLTSEARADDPGDLWRLWYVIDATGAEIHRGNPSGALP